MLRLIFCSAFVLATGWAGASAQSPYVGQETREIKALSPQEIADYLSGTGMGLAKAAELNGYPGPAHVLELATQLALTEEQRVKTRALFQKMRADAVALGRAIVEEERVLDRLFASRTITAARLESALARIGRLQSQLRQVHLEAHLEQTALLTPQQIAKYNELRGYRASAHRGHGGHQH
jgi:Spy/CpxP family protein refolding chaperone